MHKCFMPMYNKVLTDFNVWKQSKAPVGIFNKVKVLLMSLYIDVNIEGL